MKPREFYIGRNFRFHLFRVPTKTYGRFKIRLAITLWRFHALLTWE